MTSGAGPNPWDAPPATLPVAPPRFRPPPPFASVHHLPFDGARRETPTAMTFRFTLHGSDFRYLPNQFIAIVLSDVSDPWGPVRRFSLSSSPTESDAIAITAKLTGTPYKQRLATLQRGETVEVRGPIGHFVLEGKRAAVMIAGGVGISPFRGMIRYSADVGLQIPIRLLYSARVPEEFAFQRELDGIARTHENVKIAYTVTRLNESRVPWDGRTGRIDAAMIRAASENLEDPMYYVCGTPAMVEGIATLLFDDLRISGESILLERFLGY